MVNAGRSGPEDALDQIDSPGAAPRTNPLTAPIPCPLCEYDLRGLTEPHCPECGYCYTWGELDDPARRFHPYLFEHHPDANAWSFGKTLLGGLKPSAFWGPFIPLSRRAHAA